MLSTLIAPLRLGRYGGSFLLCVGVFATGSPMANGKVTGSPMANGMQASVALYVDFLDSSGALAALVWHPMVLLANVHEQALGLESNSFE